MNGLDALTHRLRITIAKEVRPTGLSDTLATADAFVTLMLKLTGRGPDTFGKVFTEGRKRRRLLKNLV